MAINFSKEASQSVITTVDINLEFSLDNLVTEELLLWGILKIPKVNFGKCNLKEVERLLIRDLLMEGQY